MGIYGIFFLNLKVAWLELEQPFSNRPIIVLAIGGLCPTSRSRGLPAPKIMQFSGNVEQILGSGPNSAGPLTKILDPPCILAPCTPKFGGVAMTLKKALVFNLCIRDWTELKRVTRKNLYLTPLRPSVCIPKSTDRAGALHALTPISLEAPTAASQTPI